MTRRPNLEAELPTVSKWRLLAAGLDIEAVQAWLDSADCDFDGATGVLDVFLPAEAVHDFAYAHHIEKPDGETLTRSDADALFRLLMLDLVEHDEQSRFGRLEGAAVAWWRWAGVRVLGNPIWGLVTAAAWNPTRKHVWVS